jgi:4-hydroxybenzoate polyprenyltransferase
MPLLGLLYSGKLLKLKKYLFPAVIAITLGQHSPLLLGYFLTTDSLNHLPVFISTFFFCLAVIPLKDLTDVKGDAKCGFENWLAKLGRNKLLLASFSILLFNIGLVFVFPLPWLYRIALIIFNLTPISLISLAVLKNRLIHVYKKIIVAVIVEGIVFVLLLKFFWNGELTMG